MTMTSEGPAMGEMQNPFPQQVIVGILVPADHVNCFPNSYQAVPAPAFYGKPEQCVFVQPQMQGQMQGMQQLQVPVVFQPQVQPPVMRVCCDNSSQGSGPVTPRNKVPATPETHSDVEREDREAEGEERPKLSTSAARRMRRKRAAERAALAAVEQTRVALPLGDRVPVSAGRLQKVTKATYDSILDRCDSLRSKLASGIADEVQEALATIQGHVWQLAQHATGCRLVQLGLEADQQTAALLARELHGHVQEAAISPHANYVIQKVVSTLTFANSRFVARELFGSCGRLARHRYACRIFCRLLEFCGSRDLTLQLIDELLLDAEDLCRHNFGHHVVQSVLEHGHERHRKIVAKVLGRDLLGFAKHRNASYLVEKAMWYCAPEDQAFLLKQLARTDVIVDLARSQFGCYVAKSLLHDDRVDAREAMSRIQASSIDLQRSRHGHRLLVEMGLADDPTC